MLRRKPKSVAVKLPTAEHVGDTVECFVIMPFGDRKRDPTTHEKLTSVYADWIKPCVESIVIADKPNLRFVCQRVDADPAPGELVPRVIQNLVESHIVIADLSGRNANVFYELGIRHAVSNNTILVADSLEDVPFDLRNQRTIVYSYDPAGMKAFERELRAAILRILGSDGERIDNPARQYLVQRETRRLVEKPAPPGYDAVREILVETSDLKRRLLAEMSDLRQLVKDVTTPPQPPDAGVFTRNEALVGVWRGSDGSLFCFGYHGDDLLVPYQYPHNRGLTAVIYNCQFRSGRLYGRFRWLSGVIAGRIYFKEVPGAELEGGWWADDQLPGGGGASLPQLDVINADTTYVRLHRVGDVDAFPTWAGRFFKSCADTVVAKLRLQDASDAKMEGPRLLESSREVAAHVRRRVRTDEEQTEHDLVIKAVVEQFKSSPRYRLHANAGTERNVAVGHQYPDIVVTDGVSSKVRLIMEVETASTVGDQELDHWRALAGLGPPLYLVTPYEARADAERLCTQAGIKCHIGYYVQKDEPGRYMIVLKMDAAPARPSAANHSPR